MDRQEAETILSSAGSLTDGEFPLLEAAIACAIHEEPARDAAAAREVAAIGVERLTQRLKRESPEEAIAETMAGDLGLSGDLFTPDDPDNADVVALANRRRGLAVTIGVYYLHAARRCGLTVQGVDFPGHFLLRIETEEGPLALDPFSEGRVVLPSELTRRALHAGLTPNVADRLDRLMAPVSDRAVLLRLQNVVFAQASKLGDFGRAERAALRRALLDPTDHRPWLDVASAREGQGALAGALEALQRATALDGGAALAARAQRERVRLKLN
ncbi:transglutaminase family protein [uncultured Phenylobacterium sp.]|uniref:transglutaminase family protein n=1 Tax=uncultured Phenylobacterium sp. TaxID=349273 RepID=UPI0025E8D32E|nr:transglutaminase family protein [uncultured Phenylobacterium sp.]